MKTESYIRRPFRPLLIFIPALLLVFGLWQAWLQTPYFYGNYSDPEYAYLFNSLNILHLETPGHTDHPGTTVQSLGAVVVGTKHLLECTGPCLSLDQEVLRNPEANLAAIHLTLLLIFCVALVFASHEVYKVTQSLSTSLIFQTSLPLFIQVDFALARARPEPLLLSAALTLIALVLRETAPKSDNSNFRSWNPIWIGMTIGFGLVTKVTFLPLALTLSVIQERKRKLIAVAAGAVSFFVLTIPIWNSLRRFTTWIRGIITHQGLHGEGKPGIPPLITLVKNLRFLCSEEPTLFIAFLFGCAGLLWLARFRKSLSVDTKRSSQTLKILSLSLGTILLQIVITIKHPGATYLLPAMVFAALVHVCLFQIFGNKMWLYIGILAAMAIQKISISNRVASRYAESINRQTEYLKSSPCWIATYYRSSRKEYALFFGNSFANRNYSNQIFDLYPKTLYYEIGDGHFSYLNGAPADAEVTKALERRECVLFVGTTMNDEYRQYFRHVEIDLVVPGVDESIYQLRQFHM